MTPSSSHFVFGIMALEIVFSSTLASCNLPLIAPATEAPNAAFTASAQTVQVQLTQSALFTPSNTSTPSPSPSATNTPIILPTTAIPTLTPAPPSATPICNKAQFIKDETVPDGTIYSPGAAIVKTWQLKNVGACTWTSGYVLLFDHGQSMGPSGFPPDPVALTTTVAPGQMVDVTVNLIAPPSPGNYQADFHLRSAGGIVFGVGPTGRGTFWVKIVVLPGTSYP